jgi:CubicO group peptidase (beta-lactamase class C family)
VGSQLFFYIHIDRRLCFPFNTECIPREFCHYLQIIIASRMKIVIDKSPRMADAMVSSTKTLVYGSVAPGFELVAEEFERNFTHRGELGAACTVYCDGNIVVDLWGGVRDEASSIPWEEDTLVPVFSTTKGLASMAVAHAHSHGLFDYDDLVATYWQDFAQNGKESITIRQLLSHQAGLCALDEPLDFDTIADPNRIAAVLARQQPAWIPGTKHGYHAQTLGSYESELIRQVDPQHRTLGQYFQDEIAKPLELEFYIGLPDDVPASRVATLKGFRPWHLLLNINKVGWPLVSALLNQKSLTARAFMATTVFKDIENYNNRPLQAIEFASANGIGRVRDIARAYGEFATGGDKLGINAKTLSALTEPSAAPSDGLFDEVLRAETSFSLGYLKPSPSLRFGVNEQAFGMPGTGGSFAFADPEMKLGYAYAMNKCGFYPVDDPRDRALRKAVYHCL